MINVVVGAIVIVIVGSALVYLIRAKKNGVKCVGCPAGGSCSSCSCCSSSETNADCCSHTDEKSYK